MAIFTDRFTFTNPNFSSIANELDELTEDQIRAVSPELLLTVEMVRRHSILIQSVSIQEIYSAITQHADPEVALILASAKNSDGSFRYISESQVKQFMFRNETSSPTNSSQIFVDGIRRVSASLAAALLINSYAPAGQLQVEASSAILEKAFNELDRILSLPDMARSSATDNRSNDLSLRLFFTAEEIALDFPLTVEYFIAKSGRSTSWSTIATYPVSDVFYTKRIVADIADAINSETLQLVEGANIITSAVLSSQSGFYHLEFAPRRSVNGLSAEVVSIRFTYGSDISEPLPFRWGLDSNNLTSEWLNSVLLIPNGSRFSAAAAEAAQEQIELKRTVIYFKRDLNVPVSDLGKFRYRVSTSDTQEFESDIPREFSAIDANRPSDLGLLLLNSLIGNRNENYLIGVILRNDPLTSTDPMIAIELVAWSITNPHTWITFDLLEVPSDILTSIGDERGPVSEFSSLPKSLKIDSEFSRWFGRNNTLQVSKDAIPLLSKMPRSKMLDHVNDVSRSVSGFIYGEHFQ
ncbi:hypothetical protein ACQ4M3_19020 [Leptolyngbya sp. AN03gr2]|uniref:hypothetical protein n=1 Tax=Leptolyngbya sp. AN03gr2 TaxID=3423364 RepID=UPI003D30FA88